MNDKENNVLETERLILRPLTPDDYDAVHSWGSNPANTRYMGWGPNNEEQTRGFLATVKPGKDFAVVLKESGKVIGSGGLYPDDANDTAELGWILHRDYWKRGYGTEFGGELIRYGFENLKLRRIFAPCAAVNYGSYRVMERNGMRREAVHVKAFWARVDKEWIDQAVYAILAEDYFRNARKAVEPIPSKMRDEMDKPQNIYDNETFFDGYKKLRENPYSANILEEKPALFSLAPDLTGKAILDLGCGYGENCAEFKRRGASRVVGIDISEKMLEIAKKENTGIEFIRADMSDLSCIDGRFDVVFSSLAVHYIKNFASFVAGVDRILTENGVFIFSQEHPLTTAPPAGASWTRDENKNVLHYNLMGYMRRGQRSTTWFVDNVIKYHRPFSEIANALIDNGFIIEKIIEPVPTEETIKRLPQEEKQLDKPNFLLIKAKRGC